MSKLSKRIDTLTKKGDLYETLPDDDVRCVACAHRCLIREGKRGICKVRYNKKGILMVPWGYVTSLNPDPIEKKPLYHFLPGEKTLTFGMLGCSFHCDYCQNWVTSQALRDDSSEFSSRYVYNISPEQIVSSAVKSGSKIVASSYNEPLITAEWAKSIFELAKEEGLKCVFVSNGNATKEVLEYLSPYLDGFKVDLKTIDDKKYRSLGGVLENVLDGIRMAHDYGMWVEIVTLLVPGFNDSEEEIIDMAQTIRKISVDIPWHISAFHPDYRLNHLPNTKINSMINAAEIGEEMGLNHVYLGNIHGRSGGYENTKCPKCQSIMIQRYHYNVIVNNITNPGCCTICGTQIAGVWRNSSLGE